MEQEPELVPIEQQTLTFYNKPLVVVRLPDGRPGVILGFMCENLQIDTTAQIKRIRRTEVIADDLVFVRIDTPGGPQRMAALILHSVPFWLAGIDPRRVREEIRPEILRYQREVVDVLYAWASAPKVIAAPADLVPSEPITEPTRPVPDAPLAEWHEYHLRMAAVIEWQMEVETWRGSVESRLEGLEAMTNLIPEILDRLGPQTLTPAHQSQFQQYVKRLHETTGKPYPTIYEDVKLAFAAPRYQDIPEAEWEKVMQWFRVQIERAKKR